MFSKAIWKANWKRFWIIPILAFAILFLGITFQMIMETQDIQEREKTSPYTNRVIVPQTAYEPVLEDVNRIENQEIQSIPVDTTVPTDMPIVKPDYGRYLRNILYNPVNVIMIFTLPVMVSILLYGYMMGEKSSSFIHGLPISKKKIYTTNVVTGIAMYVLPYMINLVILQLLQLGKMGEYIPIVELWKWFGINLLYHTIFFSFSTLVGMFCASKISHGILTYVLMYEPIGILVILSRILEEIIYGFYAFSSQIEELFLKSPFIKVWTDFNQISYYYENAKINIEGKNILIYMVVSAIMLILSLGIYKRRKLETTKEFIAFKGVRIFLKYSATLCVHLLSYLYFHYMLNESKIGSMVASLILTIIAYFIIEMILKKTYKVLPSWKGAIVYTIIISSLYAIASNGMLGYETRIPKIEEVKEIELTRNEETIAFDEAGSKKIIRDFHEKIINNKTKGYQTIVIKYTLNNGKKVSRKYGIDTDNYKKELKTIYESNEYIEEVWKTIEDITKVKEINLSIRYKTANHRYQNKEITIQEKEKKEFLNLLLQDMKQGKAKIRYDYYTAQIATVEGEQIVDLSIRIALKEKRSQLIYYTKVDDLEIQPYINLE